MPLNIAVFGMGYVGCVSAACLASRGNSVIGVDVNPDKIAMVNEGRTPVVEERIGDLIAEQVQAGRLRATVDHREAIAQTDVALVCVGTPSAPSGALSTRYLEEVAAQIGEALTDRSTRYTVVLRSTMLPGTSEEVIAPLIEKASGLTVGEGFGLAYNPEFLREGTSVKDFFDPPKTVIGQSDPASGDVVAELYEGLPGPVYRTDIRVAEMVKYCDNSFHALKVGFANEVGRICKALKLDSHAVMDIFTSDRKLNISPAYLKPGYAFGGSCLPKDLRAITYAARHADVPVPILENIIPSNTLHIDRAFDAVAHSGARKVGMFGLSFKKGTDDLRESPLVELAERLVGRGFDLKIYDDNVSLSTLMGANRAYVDSRIPHLNALMATDAAEVAAHGEVLVVGNANDDVVAAIAQAPEARIIDLVRYPGSHERQDDPLYHGLCW